MKTGSGRVFISVLKILNCQAVKQRISFHTLKFIQKIDSWIHEQKKRIPQLQLEKKDPIQETTDISGRRLQKIRWTSENKASQWKG